MDTNIIFQTTTAISAATVANRFAALYYMGAGAFSATANLSSQSVMPIAGTLKNLYIANDNAAGVGATRTYAVYQNGVQTSLAVTLSGASQTTGNDTTHTVSVSAGDTISIITNGTGSTASTGNIRIALDVNAAANTSCVLAVSGASLNTAATSFVPVQSLGKDNTASNIEAVMPTNGTLKNAYAVLNSSPGLGTSYTATLVQNGSTTALTFTIADTATTGNDTTHSVSVSAGDRLYWQITEAGTPTGRQIMISAEFDPTINGESVHMFGGSTTQTTTAVRYMTLASSNSAYNATETIKESLSLAATWQKLYVFEQTAIATGSYNYQPMINNAAAGPTVTISTGQTGNDTVNTTTTNNGDTISMRVTPSSPTASFVEWGIVSFIQPPSTTPVSAWAEPVNQPSAHYFRTKIEEY